MKIKYFSLLFLTLLLNAQTLFAAGSTKAKIEGLRPLGMGGAFTAISDDQNAFFYNPAGITRRTGSLFGAFGFEAGINNEANDFYSFYTNNEKGLSNFENLPVEKQTELLNKINKEIVGKNAKIFVSAPNIYYIAKPVNFFGGKNNKFAWGLGAFSYADVYAKFNRSMLVPSLSYQALATGIVSAPLAYKIDKLPKIPGKLSVGVNLKYLYSGISGEEHLSVVEFENVTLKPQTGSGYGLDAGITYHYSPRWNFAVSATDLFYTTIRYDKYENSDPAKERQAFDAGIRPEYNIGASYVPSKIYYWKGKYINTLNRLIFAADLTDIANTAEERLFSNSFFKKVHFGGEFTLRHLALRAGVNSGYPSFGFGVYAIGLAFEYAHYSKELGYYAGQEREINNRFSVSLRFGNSYRQAEPVNNSTRGKKETPQKKPSQAKR